MSKLTLALLVSFFLLSPTISAYSQPWCSKTPNPQPCEYYLTHNPKYNSPIKGKPDFFKVSSQLALDGCTHAQNNIYHLGPKCRNKREKAAWSDCIALYEETIRRINNTIDPKCTSADAQTWLSAALTNLETCKLGFQVFGITDYVSPMMSNNVSLLLSNALALNKGKDNYGHYYTFELGELHLDNPFFEQLSKWFLGERFY